MTTIVNSITITRSADRALLIDNIDKVNSLSFQPVSFTGRDEDIDDQTRRSSATLSHLAHDVKTQTGIPSRCATGSRSPRPVRSRT